MSEPGPPDAAVPEAAVRLLALRRLQDEVREEVRAEAWLMMRRRFRFAAAGLALLSLVVGALLGYYGGGTRSAVSGSAPDAAPNWGCVTLSPREDADALVPQPTPWPIRVYVSGAVVEERVVELPPGSLVSDALDAVGGPSSDADLTALNLAGSLRDHQHVQVPRLGLEDVASTPVAAGDAPAPSPPGSLVDLNTATPEELESLPGIGPTRARDIVAYREANGPFTTAEDLMQVPGIGPATFEQLAPLVGVEAPGVAP